MKINNKNLKTLVFSLGLAAMTLTANNLNAEDGGGLFNGRLFAGGGLFGLGPMPESEEAISEESLFGDLSTQLIMSQNLKKGMTVAVK